MSEITLYGAPASLYTGRARSYLIKAGLAYREIAPNTRHYADAVLPKAGGRRGIPTLETETGEVIRDGAAIIDHYEARNGHRFSPTTPKQRVLSRLLDVIGAEGLLRPGMHYRWNFPEQNDDWLVFNFGSGIPSFLDRAALTKMAMARARMAGQLWGAVPEAFKIIEELYLELLEHLNAHFSDQPYLLGGKPSIGDFGMIAPFYGHLGRDPKPLSLMQEKAIRLFRWVERMNRPEPDVGEFDVKDEAYLENDHIPDTLIAVLKHLAVDFVPETKAAADHINAWIDAQDELPPGTVASTGGSAAAGLSADRVERLRALRARGVGQATFDIRGVTISAMAQPYRFYLLKRVQDEHASLDEAAKADVEAMLAACDMSDVLGIRLSRDIGREDNMEIWL